MSNKKYFKLFIALAIIVQLSSCSSKKGFTLVQWNSTCNSVLIDYKWDENLMRTKDGLEFPVVKFYFSDSESALKHCKKNNILEGGSDGFIEYSTFVYGLLPSTTYYFRFSLTDTNGLVTHWSDIIAVKTKCVEDMEFVDLGLSVKWANKNLGAYSSYELGGGFTWAGTKASENTITAESNGIRTTSDGRREEKYCVSSPYGGRSYTKYALPAPRVINDGYSDGKTVLEEEDDAAFVYLGKGWRMPTKNEFNELINLCRWEFHSESIVTYYKVIGPNGNSINLPIYTMYENIGYNKLEDRERRINIDKGSAYWSSSLCDDSFRPGEAYFFMNRRSDNRRGIGLTERFREHQIRPVHY